MAALSNSEFPLAPNLALGLAQNLAQTYGDAIAPLAPSQAAAPPVSCIAGMQLGDLVDALPTVLSPQTSIQAAAQVMRERALSCVVVADNDAILGLFTEPEVFDAVAAGLDVTNTPIGLGREPQVPVLRPTDSLTEALGVMQAANLSHLLVVDPQGQVCGVVPSVYTRR